MNIGATIKKLRRGKEITQEQLAEYLNVTAQAVSRWETGTALPDITQVPALANIFGVSSDELLGIDIAAREARIEAIINGVEEINRTGRGEEAIALLRTGLKEFPNSYTLMESLAGNLLFHGDNLYTPEEHKTAMTEVISLGEIVLAECTDDTTRHAMAQTLCYAHADMGDHEKAKSLANKMPNKYCTQDNLLGYILKGTELYEHRRSEVISNISLALDNMINLHIQLDDGTHSYTVPERLALHHKALDICHILFEDENFGYFHTHLTDLHRRITLLHLYENPNPTAALQHLEKAAHHAVTFDTLDMDSTYTSLILRNQAIGVITKNHTSNESHGLLKAMQSETFNPLRTHADFQAIEATLRAHAKA